MSMMKLFMIKHTSRGVIPPSASGMRRPAMWLWAVLLAAAAGGLEAQSTAPSVPTWKDATFDKVGKRAGLAWTGQRCH